MASFLDAVLGRSANAAGQPIRPTGSIGEEAGGALRQLFVGGLTGRNPGSFSEQFASRNAQQRELALQDALKSGDVRQIAQFDPRVAAQSQDVQSAQDANRRAALARRARAAQRAQTPEEQASVFRRLAPDLTPEEQAALESGGLDGILALTTDPSKATQSAGRVVQTNDGVFIARPDGSLERVGDRPVNIGFGERPGGLVEVRDPLTGQVFLSQPGFGGGQPASQAHGGPDGGALQQGQFGAAPVEESPVIAAARREEQAKAQGRELGSVEGQTAGEDVPFSQVGLARFEQSLEKSQAGFDAADRIISGIVEQAGPFSTGPASLTAFIPGTPAANLAARLKAATGNIINREIQQLKELSANGSTGFGSLTELEAERIANQFAALEQAQSGAQFTQEAQALQQTLKGARERVLRAAERERAIRAPRGQAQQAPARIRLDDFLRETQ